MSSIQPGPADLEAPVAVPANLHTTLWRLSLLHFLYRCYMFIYMGGTNFGMSGTVSESVFITGIHGGLVLMDRSTIPENMTVFYMRTLLIGVYLSWYHYLAGEVSPPYQRISVVFMLHLLSDLYTKKRQGNIPLTSVDQFGATLLLTGFVQSIRWQDVVMVTLIPIHASMFTRSLVLYGPTATFLHNILWRLTMVLPFVLMSYEDTLASIILSVIHVYMPGSTYLVWALAHYTYK